MGASDGTGNRGPVLAVHGAGGDGRVWNELTDALLPGGHQLRALDLPAHGGSGGAVLETIEEMADWVLASAEEAGLERFVLAGHSMGSLVALEAAARAPDRVSGLMLLATAAAIPVHPDLITAARDDLAGACGMFEAWAVAPGHVEAAAKGAAIVAQSTPGVLASDLLACNVYQAAPKRAAEVACDVLMVLGEVDKMTPADSGRDLAAHFKSCRVQVIPDCGHVMMWEAFEETTEAIVSFLSGRTAGLANK